jgi:hypothetical protein
MRTLPTMPRQPTKPTNGVFVFAMMNYLINFQFRFMKVPLLLHRPFAQ